MALALKQSELASAKRITRYAIMAWLVVLVSGLLSWGTRAMHLGVVTSALMAVVWLFAIAFVCCCVALFASIVSALLKHSSRRNNGT